MSSEFIGTVNATRPMYLKGASDLTIRSRYLLKKLQSKGQISYNNSGTDCIWQVMFSQPTMSQYGDGQMLDFPNHDAYRQLSIDWRGYSIPDSMPLKSSLMNKGDEALINLFQAKQKNTTKSMRDKFPGELFKDGYLAGRENAVHGLETFLGAGTVAAGDKIAQNSDTYAGLSTTQQDQGGTWSANASTFPNATLATDWPDGQGDTEYDYLSAKLVNLSSTAWGTGATSWEVNCWRAVSQGITWVTTTGGDDGYPDVGCFAANAYQAIKNHEEAIRRIAVPFKTGSDIGLGAPENGINIDGVQIMPDFDVPYNTGYLLNTSTIEIRSLGPDLFMMKGPDEDPRTGWSYLWATFFYGNVTYQPKHVAKIYPYA